MRTAVLLTAALSISATAAFAAKPSADASSGPALAAPPGVTFEVMAPAAMDPIVAAANAMAAMNGLVYQAKVVVYADGKGKTLYTFDKDEAGKSNCTGECAAAWPPFLASANAKPYGRWSLVTRDDGTKQWAENGKPLYTFVKDEKPGEGKGDKVMQVWHAAVFDAVPKMDMPPGILARDTIDYDGQVLADAHGMTLYTSDADKAAASNCMANCLKSWTPLEAPRIAMPVGEFTIIGRADGTKQWAFKGKPLYTFAGDETAGEVNGGNVDKQWHATVLTTYYRPADITIRMHPKHGPMLATSNGMTIYAHDQHRFTLAGGAHDDRSAMRGTPATGRRIGVAGCIDDCLQNWTPVKAPADAVGGGYWTVATRPDGSKQWAYLGYPLYTYNADKKPGDALGHDIYKLTDGTTGLFWRVALP